MATGARAPAAAARRGGYAALRAYAPIGDGRSVALVSDGGSIDWLAWPDLDSPSVFAALLDAGTGGSCVVAPTVPFTVSRRYLPATNVLETTFLTRSGAARVRGRPDPSGPGAGAVPGGPAPRRGRQRCSAHAVGGATPFRVRPAPHPARLALGRARGHLWQRRAGGLLVRRRHAGPRRRRHPWQLLDQPWLQRRGGPLRRAPGAAGVPHPRGAGPTARRHDLELARVGGLPFLPGAVAGRRAAKRTHPQAAGVRPLRCPGRRGDDLATRGGGWRAELGLPLLLGP